MSASCFLPGTGSPSLSCAFLCQSHLCLSHLAWRYYPISPVSLSLYPSVSLCLPLSSSPPPCGHALLNKQHFSHRSQPHHGPTSSFTHFVVPPMFVLIRVQFWCKNSQNSLLFFAPSTSSSSPRNEGAPTHSCHWPGWPHRATEGQWWLAVFPGIWGKRRTLKQHRSTPLFLNNVDVMSAMFACNFHVYAFDPYKCILMDYESLFPHKFL